MTSETPQLRLGRLVRARRKALKMTQSDVQAVGGPSTATLRLIENGRNLEFRDGTGVALERAIGWAPGSIDAILAGGEPTPLSYEPPALPALPRNAPNMPVLGSVDKALGIHPATNQGQVAMSAEDRKLLLSARNKLVHIGVTDAGFTEEETRALTKFIEDNELQTLHVRIDWLPRAEQLEVSALVDALQSRLEERWVADGYNNESERLPDYAQPNPLPVEGIAPDPADFPSQPISMKEQGNVVEATPQSDASGEAGQVEEAGSPDDPQTPPSDSGPVFDWLADDEVKDGNQGP